VNATAGGSPEILVSSGLQKSVRVKVDNIAQFIVQTRFVCQFNIEGRVTSVNAQLLSDTIYCDEMDFTYTSRAPNITATFAGENVCTKCPYPTLRSSIILFMRLQGKKLCVATTLGQAIRKPRSK
jgi:hypothetical protein